MKEVIKFSDINADGCGTDINVYIQVSGPTNLTNGVINRTKEVIEKYKEENEYEWDTNDITDIAIEHLEKEGYECSHIFPSYCIEF